MTDTLHSDVAAKRDQIAAHFLPLLDAYVAALIAEQRVDAAIVSPASEREVAERAQQLSAERVACQRDLYDSIDEQLTIVAQYLVATQALPRTVYDACVATATFQLDYENTARSTLALVREHRELDVQSARVKGRVIARLKAEQALSDSAADKQASSDKEYTDFRDSIVAAKERAEQAEVARDVALERLRTSRELLKGLVQVSEARAGRPSIVLARGPEPHAAPPQTTTAQHDENGVKLDAAPIGDVVLNVHDTVIQQSASTVTQS